MRRLGSQAFFGGLWCAVFLTGCLLTKRDKPYSADFSVESGSVELAGLRYSYVAVYKSDDVSEASRAFVFWSPKRTGIEKFSLWPPETPAQHFVGQVSGRQRFPIKPGSAVYVAGPDTTPVVVAESWPLTILREKEALRKFVGDSRLSLDKAVPAQRPVQ